MNAAVVVKSISKWWVLINPFLGGTDFLGKCGELDAGSRQRDSVTEWSRGGGLNQLLSVCLPDPKDPSGSPSAASEYIAAPDAQLHSPPSASFLPIATFEG